MYAPVTLKDRNQAQQYWNQLVMHEKYTITNCVNKFRRAIKNLTDVNKGIPLLTEYELINLFIQKCLQSAQNGSDIHNSLFDYQKIIKRNGNNMNLPFTLSELEHDLCQQENQVCNATPKSHPCVKHNHRKEQANQATMKTFSQYTIKFLKCGGYHKLLQCKKATAQEKKDLWIQNKAKFKKKQYNPSSTTPTTTNTANAVTPTTATPQATSTPTPRTISTPATAYTARIVSPRNKQSTRFHFASMAKAQAFNCSADRPKTTNNISLMSQWLMDSGCSNHMTPFKEDLIMDQTRVSTYVEVANGNIVKALYKELSTYVLRISMDKIHMMPT